MYLFLRCLMLALGSLPMATLAGAEQPSLWPAHDTSRPRPQVITPASSHGQPPSDAIVLFDGTSLAAWESAEGAAPKWRLVDGLFIAAPDSGPVQTKAAFGDAQFHIEWSAPKPAKGKGQGRGNSGVYFMQKYEVQILDSFENKTYADGQAAAIYGQNPPMVNACRAPGEWQSYDIIFRQPRFRSDGALSQPAVVTVFHNGVLVQDHFQLWGPTNWLKYDRYTAHADKLPIRLQDHGNPVRFRNIWLRELPEPPSFMGLPAAAPAVELTAEQLEPLLGDYERFRVSRTGDQLKLHFFGRAFDLVPQTPSKFAFRHTDASVTFDIVDGVVEAMVVDLMGDQNIARKLSKPTGEVRPMQPDKQQDDQTTAGYIGLTEEAAIALARQENRPCRVVERDGQPFPVTRDYRPQRVNLRVRDGVVYAASRG